MSIDTSMYQHMVSVVLIYTYVNIGLLIYENMNTVVLPNMGSRFNLSCTL